VVIAGDRRNEAALKHPEAFKHSGFLAGPAETFGAYDELNRVHPLRAMRLTCRDLVRRFHSKFPMYTTTPMARKSGLIQRPAAQELSPYRHRRRPHPTAMSLPWLVAWRGCTLDVSVARSISRPVVYATKRRRAAIFISTADLPPRVPSVSLLAETKPGSPIVLPSFVCTNPTIKTLIDCAVTAGPKAGVVSSSSWSYASMARMAGHGRVKLSGVGLGVVEARLSWRRRRIGRHSMRRTMCT
jgi:hypothetical protein